MAGDGVEDDGGEVGHEVRRLAAQRRQVPHPRDARVLEQSLGAGRGGHHGRAARPRPAPAAGRCGRSRAGEWTSGRRRRRGREE